MPEILRDPGTLDFPTHFWHGEITDLIYFRQRMHMKGVGGILSCCFFVVILTNFARTFREIKM